MSMSTRKDTQMTAKKFEPIYEGKRRVRITGMAATSIRDNLYSVSRCTECGAKVAWAESKNGKWYPCETAEYITDGGNPRFRAMPYEPHRCQEEVWVLREENPYGIYQEFATQAEAQEARLAQMRRARGSREAYIAMMEMATTETEKAVYSNLIEAFTRKALGDEYRIEMHYKKRGAR